MFRINIYLCIEQTSKIMKKRMLLILTGLLLSITGMTAQEVPGGMVRAFKLGNAEELSGYFAKKVELIISGGSKVYDKQCAENAMDGFFSANKISGFTVNHQGQRVKSGFIVGTYTAQTGTYRINCFFRNTGNKYLIYQIRIDKSE